MRVLFCLLLFRCVICLFVLLVGGGVFVVSVLLLLGCCCFCFVLLFFLGAVVCFVLERLDDRPCETKRTGVNV